MIILTERHSPVTSLANRLCDPTLLTIYWGRGVGQMRDPVLVIVIGMEIGIELPLQRGSTYLRNRIER